MKVKGKDLEFIYRIQPTGEAIPVKDIPEIMLNQYFYCKPLSISEKTWIASNFSTYVVKVKEMPMQIKDAKHILSEHQRWRKGESEEMVEPELISKAIELILNKI